MAETSSSTVLGKNEGKKRKREWRFCSHCNKKVPKSTFYRHKVEFLDSDNSELEDSEAQFKGNVEDGVEYSAEVPMEVSYVSA